MSQIKNIPMADIVVSANNPRKTFDENYIQELAESIKENGLIQAIVVRKVGKKPNFKYELVCGECRYRACQLIGAETIKAEVTELEDKKAFEFMILENLQRKDIKPLEEAAAINRLYTEGGYKIKEISKMLGKSDSFVISRIQLTNIIPQFAELMDVAPSASFTCKIFASSQPKIRKSSSTLASLRNVSLSGTSRSSAWINSMIGLMSISCAACQKPASIYPTPLIPPAVPARAVL